MVLEAVLINKETSMYLFTYYLANFAFLFFLFFFLYVLITLGKELEEFILSNRNEINETNMVNTK